MHLRVRQTATRLGHNARHLAYGVGSTLDKMVGTAHHFAQHVDPQVAGAFGGAMGGNVEAVTRLVSKTKRNVASYEELRKSFMGARE
jgi:hypothetical protein